MKSPHLSLTHLLLCLLSHYRLPSFFFQFMSHHSLDLWSLIQSNLRYCALILDSLCCSPVYSADSSMRHYMSWETFTIHWSMSVMRQENIQNAFDSGSQLSCTSSQPGYPSSCRVSQSGVLHHFLSENSTTWVQEMKYLDSHHISRDEVSATLARLFCPTELSWMPPISVTKFLLVKLNAKRQDTVPVQVTGTRILSPVHTITEDPFDVMPSIGTPRLQVLMHHCEFMKDVTDERRYHKRPHPPNRAPTHRPLQAAQRLLPSSSGLSICTTSNQSSILAALIYLCMSPRLTPPGAIIRHLPHLHSLVSMTTNGDCFTIASWEGRYQMLLWVLAIGARVAGVLGSRAVLRARLVGLLAVVCRIAWVDSLEDLV